MEFLQDNGPTDYVRFSPRLRYLFQSIDQKYHQYRYVDLMPIFDDISYSALYGRTSSFSASVFSLGSLRTKSTTKEMIVYSILSSDSMIFLAIYNNWYIKNTNR